MVVNIIIDYCCTRKMLKQTKTQEAIGFSFHFYHLCGISTGLETPPSPFPGYAHVHASH